jgi:HlyD family secretion protein
MDVSSMNLAGTGNKTEVGRLALPFMVLMAAGVLLAGCGGSTKGDEEVAPTVTVQVDGADKEPISRRVVTDAVVYPRDQAAIVPKIVSPVKKWHVQKGDHVKADQLLVELENQDLAAAVEKSKGGYEQAQATLDMQRQKSEQDLQFAKQALDSAQKLHDSRVQLFKEGAVSAKDLDDATIALAQAKNTYDLTQKQFDLKVAEGAFSAAKGDKANADTQVGYTQIKSPISGVVTDRPFYPGETPPTGAPVVTVMDISQIIARSHIAQTEAAQLKVGNPATITVPGQPGQVKGKIVLVSPAVDANSTTVEVWVEAPNPGDKLRPGSSVQVAMVGETVPNAVVIPAAALLTAPDGATSVITLDAQNTPQKKSVKTGIRDGQNVQITEGLQGGERVVTVGAFELYNEDDPILAKTKIQVQTPKLPDEDEN